MYTVLLAVKQKFQNKRPQPTSKYFFNPTLFLRNRSALAVNRCVIIHCLKVICKDNQITIA